MNGIVVMDFIQKENMYKTDGLYAGVIYDKAVNGCGIIQSRRITLSRRPASAPAAENADNGDKDEAAIGPGTAGKKSPAARPAYAAHGTASGSAAAGSRKRARTGRSKRRACLGAARLLLLALLFSGLLAGSYVMTRASSRPVQPSWKYYTTVTLAGGETLEDLALRYGDSTHYDSVGDYVEEVCEINGIPASRGQVPALQAGTMIVIPYYSTQYK